VIVGVEEVRSGSDPQEALFVLAEVSLMEWHHVIRGIVNGLRGNVMWFIHSVYCR
jgi:hypothetical protein